jgi:TolA-binding protein
MDERPLNLPPDRRALIRSSLAKDPTIWACVALLVSTLVFAAIGVRQRGQIMERIDAVEARANRAEAARDQFVRNQTSAIARLNQMQQDMAYLRGSVERKEEKGKK